MENKAVQNASLGATFKPISATLLVKDPFSHLSEDTAHQFCRGLVKLLMQKICQSAWKPYFPGIDCKKISKGMSLLAFLFANVPQLSYDVHYGSVNDDNLSIMHKIVLAKVRGNVEVH